MFKIREADGKDLPHLLHLINIQADNGSVLKRSRKDVRKALRSFFVAEQEGRVVGCCALEIYSKKLAEVRSLVVEPGHQNKGIASALLKRCIQAAKRRDVYEVLAITDRDTIFSRHGFAQQLHHQKALFLRP